MKSLSLVQGLMGLYVGLWCWVTADPSDPVRWKWRHNPGLSRRSSGCDAGKVCHPYVGMGAEALRRRNWFQKDNGLNKHQQRSSPQIWWRIVTICLNLHADITICPYHLTDVFRCHNGAFASISLLWSAQETLKIKASLGVHKIKLFF